MARPAKPLLVAKARDVRRLAALLRSLAQTVSCQVVVSEAGLKVTTDLNQNLQAIAYIGHDLFDEFAYSPPSEDEAIGTGEESDDEVVMSLFEVNLATLLACLNIYGTASAMAPYTNTSSGGSWFCTGSERPASKAPFGSVGTGEAGPSGIFGRNLSRTAIELSYARHGEPLVLQLVEGRVTTRCELATSQDTLPMSNMPFIAEQTEAQVIMRSKDLTEALLSIDQSSKHVTFSFSDAKRPRRRRRPSLDQVPQTPRRGNTSMLDMSTDQQAMNGRDTEEAVAMMRIRADGDAGSTELEFPNRNRVFESFACNMEGSYSYDYKTLQHCLRALQASTKCSLRVDQNGMMSMQCMFPSRPSVYNGNGGQPTSDTQERERHDFVEIRLLALSDEAVYGQD